MAEKKTLFFRSCSEGVVRRVYTVVIRNERTGETRALTADQITVLVSRRDRLEVCALGHADTGDVCDTLDAARVYLDEPASVAAGGNPN